MDVENKGFHSQEGILPCQRNRSVSLFERSPRQSLVGNRDDDKAWQSGRGPLGMEASVQRAAPHTRSKPPRLAASGSSPTNAVGHGLHPAREATLAQHPSHHRQLLSDAHIRSEGSRKTRHRVDSTQGPAAKDPRRLLSEQA